MGIVDIQMRDGTLSPPDGCALVNRISRAASYGDSRDARIIKSVAAPVAQLSPPTSPTSSSRAHPMVAKLRRVNARKFASAKQTSSGLSFGDLSGVVERSRSSDGRGQPSRSYTNITHDQALVEPIPHDMDSMLRPRGIRNKMKDKYRRNTRALVGGQVHTLSVCLSVCLLSTVS
jgi:hypothetical protein